MTTTTYSFAQTIEASAKGNLDMKVKLAVTVAASLDNLSVLVKVGGWTPNAVAKASKELETFLLGYVKEYTELHEIEELSSDKIRVHLQQRVQESKRTLGLEIITLTIASFDPVNPQIADAIRQREHARIMEQTEALNQRARIAATFGKITVDALNTPGCGAAKPAGATRAGTAGARRSAGLLRRPGGAADLRAIAADQRRARAPFPPARWIVWRR